MKCTRFLIPFTHGMHIHALEHAVRLAQSHHATLVPVALLPVSKKHPERSPRLEFVQQSKDFLETVRCKAAKYQVPVEQMEVLTSDVPTSIHVLADDLACDGVLLFLHGKRSVMLDANDSFHVMQQDAGKLYVFQLAARDAVRVQLC